MHNDAQTYVSDRWWGSLWQRYSIGPTGLDLVWPGLRFPLDEVVSLRVCGSCFTADVWDLRIAHKLDLCDLVSHVVLRRRTGLFKLLRFAPPDPEAFVDAWQQLVATRPELGSPWVR